MAVAAGTPSRRRRRRRRWLLACAVALAPVLAVGALWPTTPGVGNAEVLIRSRLETHDAPLLGALPTSDRVARALVATEDSRFYVTPGVDPISAARAGFAMLTGSVDTGAATLEQQLAKNLYFPQDGGLLDKVDEAEVALKLDVGYSKHEILRMYLASVYFGHGYYGLPAAARGYFGTTPAALTWAQASLLAGLVQAPSAYDPVVHLDAARLRQRHVLNRLVATGVLTRAEATGAFAAPLGLR
ncbi:biosynthetic peptidoglycan transglycosylase [Cellulomonas sp. P24]|uniref:biosynthetic peptidoglycan transglycosylase n=1 Tax=Cellulomonas sp. P24 TaxID=2885206 RepID=UPI00216AC7C0|nr:biosynthetic peptidoglycan transglycosylase [Cellulomonas sp. P24]MCR6494681.1 transglycosylase domain-containing protein [Cellulomonas sp. P24]